MSNEEATGELHRFFDDVEELLRRVSDLGDEEIGRLRDRVESTIVQAKSRAGEGVEAGIQGARAAVQDADGYVRSNPWVAMGIAAAAGLLLGSLLSRK